MNNRRSVVAQKMVDQEGESHDIQDNEQEQGSAGHSAVLLQLGVDRLQLPVLDEFIAFLGPHGFSSG